MGVVETTFAGLATPERNELLEILAEAKGKRAPTGRYQSDLGDSSVLYLWLLLVSAGGIVAYLVVFGVPDVLGYWRWVVAEPRLITHQPATLGVQLAVPVAAWSAYKLVRILRRGHGWALASFGFARVQGDRLLLVRFSDIAKVEISRGGGGRHRRYTHVEVTARDGTSLTSYAAALLAGLKQRLPPDATVVGE